MRSFLVFPLLLCACRVELERDLLEEDANEVFAVLHEKGFTPFKLRDEANPERYAIQVTKTDASRAAYLLQKRGLPRGRQPGLELLTQPSGNIIPSETEGRGRVIQALSGEVANTLRHIPRVLEARVIVNVPEPADLAQLEARRPTSAAVYLKFRAAEESATLGLSDEQLKRFVAAAVPGLEPASVTIVAMRVLDTPDPEPSQEVLTADVLKQLVAGLAALLVLVSSAALAFFVRLRKLQVT